jgi:predicted phosphodiesterase
MLRYSAFLRLPFSLKNQMTATPTATLSPPDAIWPLVAPVGMPSAPRIHVLSDLHLDTGPYALPSDLEFDILVAAGDIGPIEISIPWLAAIGKPVVYVLGNHEHYGRAFTETLASAKALAQGSQVHVLERESVTIEGVRFLGATLWTSFGNWHPELVREASRRMHDYHYIEEGNWRSIGTNDNKQKARYQKIGIKVREPEPDTVPKFHPAIAYSEHTQTMKWLERMLKADSDIPTVVVSHHAPTFEALRVAGIREYLLKPETWDQRYRDDDLVRVAAYASPLEDFLQKHAAKIALWAHGHMHHGHDSLVRGVRVICNPRGHHDKPLTEESIEAGRLFGVALTMEHVKRSQEAFATNPYGGDAFGFEPSLVVDFQDGLMRPIELALVKPLEKLRELRASAASYVLYVFEGAEKQQEAVARCFKDDCAQFREVLDGIDAAICTHIDSFYSSSVIRSIKAPFGQPHEPWGAFEPVTTKDYDKTVATMDEWIAWAERLPRVAKTQLKNWAAQAYRALAVLDARGITAVVSRPSLQALREVSKHRVLVMVDLPRDSCQELEWTLDKIINPGIPRLWSVSVWNTKDCYGDENPGLTMTELAPWDQNLPLVAVEPKRQIYSKTETKESW